MKKLCIFVLCIVFAVVMAGCQKSYYNPDKEDQPVKYVEQRHISFAKERLSLNIGEAVNVNAQLSPQEDNSKIIYKSSDDKIVGIDRNGIAFAKATGVSTITAATQDGKVSSKCKITVQDVRKMTISGSVPITANDGDRYTVTINFENCYYPSVKIIADCKSGSIMATNNTIYFGSGISQYQVIGKTTLTFVISGEKEVNSVRIIGFDERKDD